MIFLYYTLFNIETGDCKVLVAKPTRRYSHSATLVGSHLYIFGGRDFSFRVNDLYDYNMDDGSCTLVKTSGTPPEPRGYHSAVFHDGSIYVFGGSNTLKNCYNDVHQYIICLAPFHFSFPL